jgi:hypothetical protein
VRRDSDRPLTASRGSKGLIHGYQTEIIASPASSVRSLRAS